jgi:hypothetical protein
MRRFEDLPAAIIGRLGEDLASFGLRKQGAGVIASFKFTGEGEAPAIEYFDKRTVIPDLDVAKDGSRFWLEVKTYKEPVTNRRFKCDVHGIPVTKFDEYVRVERQHGTPVYLGILQLCDGLFIVSERPLSRMPKLPCLCGCDGDVFSCKERLKRGSMYPEWYFRRDQFDAWFRLDGDGFKQLQAAHEKVAHILRRHSGALRFKAPTQQSIFDAPAPVINVPRKLR